MGREAVASERLVMVEVVVVMVVKEEEEEGMEKSVERGRNMV